MVFLAIERFLGDLERAGSKDFAYHFDQGGAVAIIQFFRDLCPFHLEPFQQFIVANLFGWKHADGLRRFQTGYIEMGKGSGKTPLAAGIGLFGITADDENAAEVYIAAPTKEQAAICFRDAANIVERSTALRRVLKRHGCAGKMLSGNLSIGGSFMRPISAEHKTLDGPRPHIVIADELHEHQNTLVLDKLTAGFKSRKQPLSFEITNSGYDRETICWYHHDYSRQVLEGVVKNEAWFAYVCQLDVCDECRARGKDQPACDNCDNWLDEDAWIKTNPGLGTILQKEYLEKQVKEALEIPATRNLKQRLNFCVWTQSEERFISPESWRTCAWDDSPLAGNPPAWLADKLIALKGKHCFGGLDLGVVNDFTCLSLYFPKQSGIPKAILLLWSWVPEQVDHHAVLKERYGYNDWVKDGFLFRTPGNRTDYAFVREAILKLDRDYRIRELAFDPYYSTQLVQELLAAGVKMVEHRQGTISMTYPIKEFQRQVIGRDFAHGMNPALTFMVDNLVVKSDAIGNLKCMKPDNPNSPRKIDGAVAAVMAIGRSAANPQASYGRPLVSQL